MAAEPEHPTGKLGQSGAQTEWTAAPLCPYIALQSSPLAPGKLPSLSDWAVEGEVVYPEEASAVFRRKANHRRLRHPSPQKTPQVHTERKSSRKASLDRRSSERTLKDAGPSDPGYLSFYLWIRVGRIRGN